jgi:hypothetical protein
MARIRRQCPAKDCSAAAPRQMAMNPEVLAKAGATGDWLSRAQRCTYCGAVYSLEAGGQKVIRGHFNSSPIKDGRAPKVPKGPRGSPGIAGGATGGFRAPGGPAQGQHRPSTPSRAAPRGDALRCISPA